MTRKPWKNRDNHAHFGFWSRPSLPHGAGCPCYWGITGKVFLCNLPVTVPRMGYRARGVSLTSWVTLTNSFPLQACRDFLMLAQTHSKKWQKSLQYERDQRIRLEETLEQLAKQHNHLERAFRGATVLPAHPSGSVGPGKGKTLGLWVVCSERS